MHWDDAADVIVVGYGGAGAAAAISAHDAGSSVLLIEKDEGGGNTKLATLTFLCPVNSPAARRHIDALSLGTLPADVIDAFIDWTSTNVEFIGALGGSVETCPPGPTFPSRVGSETMIRYRVKSENGELGGESLWNLLARNVEKRRITVRSRTPARRLLMSDGSVAGVEAAFGEKLLRLRSRKAVVLACGGFEYNDAMKRDYLTGYPIYAFGHPGNTGDGIKMAQAVGADLWHMKAVAAPMGYKVAGYDAAFSMRMPGSGFIFVDQAGKRFCNETGLEHYSMWMEVIRFDTGAFRFPRIPAYMIFDERTRRQGPITRVGHGVNRGYAWSRDNSVEIERGWIVRGGSPAALARNLGIEASEAVAATLLAYNESCDIGRDQEFGREARTLARLDGALYGIAVWPCLLNTQGGPKRNARSQILDAWGEPIRRLYGSGELGSVWGFLYQSGGNLGECLGLGRMAGLHAAKETPAF